MTVLSKIETIHDLSSFSRLVILLILIFLVVISIRLSKVKPLFLKSSLLGTLTEVDYFSDCLPGTFRGVDQLQYRTWTTSMSKDRGGRTVSLPLYSSHDLAKSNTLIKKVVIIQHGNLRNANTYFCGVCNSLGQLSNLDRTEYLVIAPQFLIDDDVCWDIFSNQRMTVKASDGINCGYPIFTSEGWKDGASAVSIPPNTHSDLPNPFYSYEVFNLLIDRVADGVTFPNVESIVLAGFSAGAQTVLRYSFLPLFTLSSPSIKVRYVVSDPSTYLYLDPLRYFTGARSSRGIPDATWIKDSWKVLFYNFLHKYFLRLVQLG